MKQISNFFKNKKFFSRQMNNSNSGKLAFVFVCQPGELEIKAMLLAASLRYYNEQEHELIAAIPKKSIAQVSLNKNTLKLMASLSVRQVMIDNYIDDEYPIGNKVSCLGVPTKADKLIFLDSDILCLKSISMEQFPGEVGAKPVDLATYNAPIDVWKTIYQVCEVEDVPSRRIISTVSGHFMPPYFNAGVIATSQPQVLSKEWIECCQKIDKASHIDNKRPWLDQLGLPVAIAKTKMEYVVYGDDINFPAHLKTLPAEDLPFLCHYHWPSIIQREPVLQQLFQSLIKENQFLEKLVIEAGGEWESLLKRNSNPALIAHDAVEKQNDILITGIPRSGTSLLCKLLHELSNTVIINEPKKIFGPLGKVNNPYWLSMYYQELRRDILHRKAIENKVVNGVLIEDTNQNDLYNTYYPEITTAKFILGTKNTLLYLSRMDLINKALSHAIKVACIRHPLDTIASWKGSFEHLSQVDFTKFPTSYSDRKNLTGQQLIALENIEKTNDLRIKRALLWNYLAQNIIDNTDRLVIIRYEDLISNSKKQLTRIIKHFEDYKMLDIAQVPLTARTKRDLLEKEDFQVIADICGQTALKFGYHL